MPAKLAGGFDRGGIGQVDIDNEDVGRHLDREIGRLFGGSNYRDDFEVVFPLEHLPNGGPLDRAWLDEDEPNQAPDR